MGFDPLTVPFSAIVQCDVNRLPGGFSVERRVLQSLTRNFVLDKITSDFAIVVSSGQDGDEFAIEVSQAAAGGKVITSVTAPGRTVLLRDDLTTLNTTPYLVADAVSVVSGRFASVGGVAVLILDIHTGTPAGVPLATLLSSYLIDYWDPAVGGSLTLVGSAVAAITGQKTAYPISQGTPALRPTLSAANTSFFGKPTMDLVAGQFLVNSVATAPLIASGAATMYVATIANAPSDLFAYGNASFGSGVFRSFQSANTQRLILNENSGLGIPVSAVRTPQAPAFVECYLTGGILNVSVNGVVVSAGSALTLGGDICTLALPAFGASIPMSIAWHGFGATVPPASVRAAALQAARQLYGAV